MNIDFSNTISDLGKTTQVLEALSETYRLAEWEDEVHMSYAEYIRICNDSSNVFRTESNQLNTIACELKNIKLSSNMKSEIDVLSKQCDAIAV